MLKQSEKQLKRRALFAAKELAAQAWRDRVGDHWFTIQRGDHGNRDVSDPLNRDQSARVEIPCGPKFKTPQYERTSRR